MKSRRKSKKECKYRYKCPICGYISPSIVGLKCHFTEEHLKKGLRKCPVCGAEFDDVRKLRLHIIRFSKGEHEKYLYFAVSSGSKAFRGEKIKRIREMAEKYFRVKGEEA